MERKIGEIFEYNGEWCQCIVGNDCENCAFNERKCYTIVDECCADRRKDNKNVIFKKLEKVGEPFTIVGKLCQHYKVFDIDNVCGDGFWCVHNYKAKTLTIEIKQNKEDMKDLDKIKVMDYTKVEELNVMEEKKLNLKPFDIQKAREGKPVCTRDGRKARIICFDVKGDICPIIALVEENGMEVTKSYDMNGRANYKNADNYDLMMLPEKKEGWINIYKRSTGQLLGGFLYDTKKEAKDAVKGDKSYVTTIKVCWEE